MNINQTVFENMDVVDDKKLLKTPLLGITDNSRTSYVINNDYEETGELEASTKSSSSHTSRTALSGGLDTGESGTSNLATMIHLLKGNIGTGVLSLPSAVKNAGLVVGPLVLLCVALIAIHCMHLLVRCSHFFCRRLKRQALSYGEVAGECCKPYLGRRAKIGSYVVNTFLVITQLGFCAIYLIFVSTTIIEVASWEGVVDQRIIVGILVVPMVLLSYIRSLEKLAYLSILANIFCFFGLVCVLQFLIRNVQDPGTRPYFAGWANLPMFLGMAIFSFEGIGVVLPLENEMKKPEDFSWVINVGMGFIVCLFVSMGLLGYLAVDINDIQGSISLNLPDNTLYAVVKICYALAMFLTFHLQFYVPMQILLPPLLNKYKKRHASWFEYLFRTLTVILTCAVAASIPQLDNFIALVGAVASSGLAIIFPPLFHILTFKDHGIQKWEVVKNILIILLGFVSFLIGGFTAIKHIIEGFGSKNTVLILNSTTTMSPSTLFSTPVNHSTAFTMH